MEGEPYFRLLCLQISLPTSQSHWWILKESPSLSKLNCLFFWDLALKLYKSSFLLKKSVYFQNILCLLCEDVC